jgi:hypothetical protein
MKSGTIIKAIAVYSIIFLIFISFVIISSDATNNEKTIIKMGIALVVVWIIICGSLMYLFRNTIKSIIKQIPINWKLKFFLFSLFLILFEEIISTTITNLAPLFGGEIGKSFITASTNYFHVIFFHSAIMFIPFILVWTYLVSRYDFSPNQIFLLFGLLGTFAESFLNPFAIISGFWIFVYGLMIYLPAYSLPNRENLKKPTLSAYFIALIIPIIISIPLSLIVIYLRNLLGIQLFV